jgi:membrane-associated phospholipid phosphatase
MRYLMVSARSRLLASALLAILAIPVSATGALAEEHERNHSDLPFSHLFEVPPVTTAGTSDPADFTYQGPEQPPPKPVHTGFGSLVRNIGGDFKAFPQRKSTWVILGAGAVAAALAHPVDDEFNAHIQGSNAVRNIFKPGRWIGYGWVQAGAAIGTYTVGRLTSKSDGTPNKLVHMGFDLMRANILTQSLTYGLKLTFRRDRPTGECCSFPSGHASVSFAVASVLERHFGYRAAWPTFVIAGYVAASRLHDDRHFLSDVLFGSALGMASGWTVVGRHGHDSFALMPVKTPGGVMIALTKVSASSSRR